MTGRYRPADIARGLLIAVAALAPVALGRMQDWEPCALLVVVSLALLLWALSGRSPIPARWSRVDGLLAAGLLVGLVTSLFSVYLYDCLLYLAVWAAGLLVFWGARVLLAEPAWNRAGWWAAAAGAFGAALWGVREYTTSAIVMGNVSWRAFGAFYNPNCFGGYMALAFLVPVALAAVSQTRSAPPVADKTPGKKRRATPVPEQEPPPRYAEIASVMMALVIGLALLVTGSKGALLGLVAAVFVFALTGAPRGSRMAVWLRRGALGMVVLGLLASLALPSIRNRIFSALSGQKESGSFRVLTWQGTAEMVAARPLTGFGPNTFAHAYPRYARAGFTRQAHQTPLQLMVEMGVPGGLVALAGFVAVMLAALARTRALAGRERLLPAAALAGCVALWVHNLVDYTWYVTAHQLAFWFLLGLALPNTQDAEAPRPALRRGTVLAGLVIALTLGGGLLHSEIEMSLAGRAFRAGDTDAAQAHLNRVLKLKADRWVDLSRLAESRAQFSGVEDLHEAVFCRLQAISRQRTEPTHYNALGRLFARIADAETDDWRLKAIDALEQGLRYYPTSTEMLAALLRLQERQGDHADALETARRLAALYDTPVRTVQAVEYFVDDNYAYAFALLSEDALARKDKPQALRLASRALDVAVEWVRSQRQNKAMLEVAGQYDLDDIEDKKALAARASKTLQELGLPVANLRIGLGLIGLEEHAEAEAVLRALTVEPVPAPRAEADSVRAAALLGLAECAEKRESGSAEELRAEGIPLAEKALKAVASAEVAHWGTEDTTRLTGALERAKTAK